VSTCPEPDRRALGVALIEASISAERLAWIDVLISGETPMEQWTRHTGVSTYAQLKQWAEMKLREVLIMRSGREREGGPAKDEMGDYLVGKQGVLNELLSNIRQIEDMETASVTRN
jgi:hypothetical protein